MMSDQVHKSFRPVMVGQTNETVNAIRDASPPAAIGSLESPAVRANDTHNQHFLPKDAEFRGVY